MKKLSICLLILCLCIAAGCGGKSLLPPDNSIPSTAGTTSGTAETTLATDNGTTASTAETSDQTAPPLVTTTSSTQKGQTTSTRTPANTPTKAPANTPTKAPAKATTTKAPTKAPAKATTTTKATTTKAPTTQTTLSSAQRVQEVFRLVNEERAKAGVAPLEYYTVGQAAADVRAAELHTKFDHTRPDGTSFFTALDALGIRYLGAGENIALGQRTPAEVMNAWMNSEGHRNNILHPHLTHIVIGENDYGWVQMFMTNPQKS